MPSFSVDLVTHQLVGKLLELHTFVIRINDWSCMAQAAIEQFQKYMNHHEGVQLLWLMFSWTVKITLFTRENRRTEFPWKLKGNSCSFSRLVIDCSCEEALVIFALQLRCSSLSNPPQWPMAILLFPISFPFCLHNFWLIGRGWWFKSIRLTGGTHCVCIVHGQQYLTVRHTWTITDMFEQKLELFCKVFLLLFFKILSCF